MQVQTVFRAGNSKTVVAIPSHIASDVGLKPGSRVVVEKIEGENAVVIRKKALVNRARRDELPDRKFEAWWKEFLKENAGILDELATR